MTARQTDLSKLSLSTLRKRLKATIKAEGGMNVRSEAQNAIRVHLNAKRSDLNSQALSRRATDSSAWNGGKRLGW